MTKVKMKIEPRQEDQDVFRVCSFCKKKVKEFCQVTSYDKGVRIDKECYVKCSACKDKEMAKARRKHTK